MSNHIDALDSLSVAPPSLAAADVAHAVAEQFGLTGDYRSLISERDQNFRLTTADGDRFVVKVVGSAEERTVTSFQIKALQHLAAKGLRSVPRVVLTTAGAERGCVSGPDGRSYALRVVTWLAGETLDRLVMTEAVATTFGGDLASLDLALGDFSHAGENQVLLWDMQRAGELRRLLDHIADRGLRRTVDAVLSEFASNIEPRFPILPLQVIHNDANPGNVLLTANRQQARFIDFGDMLRAPRIVEVATAAAYLRADSANPLRFIAPFVTAYHRRSPLTTAELAVLYTLLQTRLCMTLVLLYWRLSTRDAADPYRRKALADEADAAAFLGNLTELGAARFLRQIRREITTKTVG